MRIAESSNSPRRTAYIEPDPHRNYVMQWNLGVEERIASNTSLSLVYAASRHESWKRIWMHAARLCAQILGLTAIATFLLLMLHGWK